MKILPSDTKLLVHFSKDKIKKSERDALAEKFRDFLGVTSVMVCDCDCEIYAFIKESNQTKKP